MRSNPLLRFREQTSELDACFQVNRIQPDNVVLITNRTVEGCPPGSFEDIDWAPVNFEAAHESKYLTVSKSSIGWFGGWVLA